MTTNIEGKELTKKSAQISVYILIASVAILLVAYIVVAKDSHDNLFELAVAESALIDAQKLVAKQEAKIKHLKVKLSDIKKDRKAVTNRAKSKD